MIKKKISTLIRSIQFPVFLLISMFPTVVWAEEKLCPNYPTFASEVSEFWPKFCFDIMKDVFCKLATLSWGVFAHPLQGVIAVGVGIYIAVYTLRTLGSFSQQDIAAYFSNNKTGLLLLMAKIAFIMILLSDDGFVYKYLVAPIIQAGATIGQSGWGSEFADVSSVSALFDKVINQIVEFNGKVHEIIAMGRLMLCLTTLPDTIIDWHWKMIPFGGVLYIFGEMIVLFLAFYMMDIIFRLGVGCVLLPFGIACGISKLTSHYTKQLWNLFINVAFNFILLKVIIEFSIQMVKFALSFLLKAEIKAILFAGGARYLNDSDAEEFLQALTLDAFVLVSLACIISVKLFLDVETIAEKLSDAPSVGKLAQKVGGDIATVAGNVGSTLGKQPFKLGGAAVAEKADDFYNSKIMRNARAKKEQARDWIKRNVFRLKD